MTVLTCLEPEEFVAAGDDKEEEEAEEEEDSSSEEEEVEPGARVRDWEDQTAQHHLPPPHLPCS